MSPVLVCREGPAEERDLQKVRGLQLLPNEGTFTSLTFRYLIAQYVDILPRRTAHVGEGGGERRVGSAVQSEHETARGWVPLLCHRYVGSLTSALFESGNDVFDPALVSDIPSS